MEQGELASITGISQASISKYESAAAAMRAEDIPNLARALGVTPTYFYEDKASSSLDELGLDWDGVEKRLLIYFRSLSPVERLALAEKMREGVAWQETNLKQLTGVDEEP